MNIQLVVDEFCKYYYHLWNVNFVAIGNLHINNSNIIYLEKGFNGFNSLLNYIKYVDNIYKFDHISIRPTYQVIDENTIMINTTGIIAANDISFRNFVETIIIKKDIWNKYYITHNTFRLIP